MTNLYWIIAPIAYAINFIDNQYKTLKRMLHLGTSEDTHLTNKAKDLDLQRHHHIDRILRVRCFNSVGMHTIKGAIPVLEEECGNLYKIQAKVINAIGGLFAKVIAGQSTEITDNFNRADGSIGTDWAIWSNGNVVIESNEARESSASYNDGFAINVNAMTNYPSQYVQALFHHVGGGSGHRCLLFLRADNNSNPDDFYVVEYLNAPQLIRIFRSKNDSWTQLNQVTGTLLPTTFTMKLSALNIGNTVRLLVHVDGVLTLSIDDSSPDRYDSGVYAGFGIFNASPTGNDVQVDDYEAGLGTIPDEYQRAISNITQVEFEDDFNRSNTSCPADAGAGLGTDWIHDATDDGLLILDNKASVNGCSAASRGFASYKNQLLSLNQAINADFTFSDHAAPGYIQLSLRQSSSVITNLDRYFLFYIGDLDLFRIIKRINNNSLVISEVSYPLRNETRNIRFEAVEISGGVELKGYIDSQLFIYAADFSNVIEGKYCGLYLSSGEAGSYIDADNFMAGSPGGSLSIVKNGTPAIILSPWIRHLIVYDENEGAYDPVGGLSDLIIYITLNGITAENSTEGTMYLWYNPSAQVLYVFKSANDQTEAYNGNADPEDIAIAKATNIESGVEKYFVQQVKNSGVFGVVHLNTSPSYVLATYVTKRHKLTEILNDYIPSHTLAFLDGFRKYNVAPYGIKNIGNGLTFSNFTVSPASCIQDETTYFRLKAGYENQQIMITGEDIELTVTDKNWLFDVVHWIRSKQDNYFRIEVKQASSQGGLTSADWRELKNNSSLRASDGTLEAWHKFRVKFMVKDVTDIIIENFVYKQVLEYLNEFFVPG